MQYCSKFNFRTNINGVDKSAEKIASSSDKYILYNMYYTLHYWIVTPVSIHMKHFTAGPGGTIFQQLSYFILS
uniref:Uncharacterized protein n=1 Tax=Acanthochromis polyacanthus TaxID=80966 RepID=A0A3Q1FI71_9TELE